MSRRQSVPTHWFYRKADPLPPLFPALNEGDHYYNTTRNVLRVVRYNTADPPVLEWQDMPYSSSDHTHAETTDLFWNYDTVFTVGDPGSGKIRTDKATGIPADTLMFSDITSGGVDASTQVLASLTVGDLIHFQEADNSANWGRYDIISAPVDMGTWYKVPVKGTEEHGAPIAKNQKVLIRFIYGAGGGGGSGGGADEVIINTTQPTDPKVDLWVDPNGTWAAEFATKAYVDGSGWTAPTLLNGWLNYGAPFDPCGYQKVGRVVYLRGLLKSGTAPPSIMFTLPAGYRPGAQLLLPVVTNSNVIGRMDILTNGSVQANVGSNGWFSVATSFIADA